MGVIGAGGVGSLVIEQLSRLGVGWLVVTDPEKIDLTNLPRIVGSTGFDARTSLTAPERPAWIRRVGKRIATPKVRIARRVGRKANPECRIDAIQGDITDPAIARRFTDCDYLLLAADGMQPRLVFNAMLHQYLIRRPDRGEDRPRQGYRADPRRVQRRQARRSRPGLPVVQSAHLSGRPSARGRDRGRTPSAELPG